MYAPHPLTLLLCWVMLSIFFVKPLWISSCLLFKKRVVFPQIVAFCETINSWLYSFNFLWSVSSSVESCSSSMSLGGTSSRISSSYTCTEAAILRFVFNFTTRARWPEMRSPRHFWGRICLASVPVFSDSRQSPFLTRKYRKRNEQGKAVGPATYSIARSVGCRQFFW